MQRSNQTISWVAGNCYPVFYFLFFSNWTLQCNLSLPVISRLSVAYHKLLHLSTCPLSINTLRPLSLVPSNAPTPSHPSLTLYVTAYAFPPLPPTTRSPLVPDRSCPPCYTTTHPRPPHSIPPPQGLHLPALSFHPNISLYNSGWTLVFYPLW